ncbi:FAD-binding oxidoreductase [Sinorhizobium numidicum]|uniref:FAD-binding oxidoreductase n=1 Tax=Sinorhizobium numidicum TaxID=680248 RepID=A0ABY8CU88_9HYPH|nr:FAD-dependent oxidoreductase [Sinorhizobium numidicum]WEX74897.1 FAD-binding oxidoreductase [Sinorhizobium numidicum]WEX80890.1 FAD-binding oxidoreductase [Sinorhizobium numidicum]
MTGKVIVLGAGIVGASTALRLADAGWNVTLCDGGRPGGEGAASYGNGGWISPASIIPMSVPGIWRKLPGYLLDRSGPLTIDWASIPRLAPWLFRFLLAGATEARVTRTARHLNSLLHDAPARHLALAQRIGQQQLVIQKGLLYAYPDRAAFEAESLSWRLRRENGVAFEEWDESELRRQLPALGPNHRFGAYVTKGAHCINTGAYVAGIVEAAIKAGVRFVQRGAYSILTTPTPRVVLDGGDSLAADYIIVAAGIHSGRLMRGLGIKIPLESERGYHVTITSDEVPFDIPVMPSTGKMANTPTEMGLRLSGQVELASVDKAPNWRRAEVLQSHALASYPYLANESQSELKLWMGHRPSTPDGLPVIGPLRQYPGIVTAFGHGHVGLASGPKTADLVLHALDGRQPEREGAFLPARFGC